MIFPEMLSQDVLSVGQLNHYLRARLDEDLVLARVWVRGEISNVKFYQAGGQIYFTLKDADAAINCVVFNNVVKDLRFSLTDNLAVVVRGKVSYFEKRGSITLQVYTVEPEGVGALALAFDQLKMKLQQEGLFLESRKKRIPAFPKCVVVITSPSGAVIHDIITTMRR